MSSTDAPESPQNALLSDGALTALGLREQPFADASTDDEAMFADEITAEQLADIRQALITGDDLLLILGEEGSGRSTLLAQLAANSGLRIQCFSVRGSPRFSTRNLFVGMLEAFKVRPPEKLKEVLDELVPCLQAMIGNNTLCVVVLDDAQAIADLELTTLLSGMLYLNGRDESLLRIALAAPPAFEERIPDLLPEGADLPYSSLALEPFDEARAARYLAFRLERAGRADGLPFDEDGIAALVERSGGRPAALNVAAAEALEAGWGVPGSASLQAGHAAAEPLAADAGGLPPELLDGERRHGGGGTRVLKLALGALAALMIVGGLLLFRPAPDEASERRYRVVEQRQVDGEAERLRLLEESERERVAEAEETAEAAPAATLDAATAADEPADTAASETAADVPAPDDGVVAAGRPADAADGDETRLARAPSEAGADAGEARRAAERPASAADPAEDASSAAAADASRSPTASEPTVSAAGSETSATDAAPTPEVEDPLPAAPSDEGTSAPDAVPADTDAPTEPAGTDPPAEAASAAPETGSDAADAPPSPAADVAAAGPDEPVGEESAEGEPAGAEDGGAAAEAGAATTGGAADGTAEETAVDVTLLDPEEAERRSPVSDPERLGVLESPNWVLVQDAGQYTVQMIASSERASVEAFLAENALPPPNSIFTFDRRGRTWYALVHGLFPSIEAARTAIERMPPEAQTNQPWIRAIGRIQNALRDR